MKLNKIIRLFVSNPEFVIKRVIFRIISLFQESLLIPRETLRFISHNRVVWKNWKNSNPTSILLFDIFEGPEVILPYSYFLNVLAKKYNSKISSFSYSSNQRFKKLRKSFNAFGHIRVKIKKNILINQKKYLLEKSKKEIKDKNDVYNFKIDDVWIGIDIYETYLREGIPTVDIKDRYFWKIFEKGIVQKGMG